MADSSRRSEVVEEAPLEYDVVPSAAVERPHQVDNRRRNLHFLEDPKDESSGDGGEGGGLVDGDEAGEEGVGEKVVNGFGFEVKDLVGHLSVGEAAGLDRGDGAGSKRGEGDGGKGGDALIVGIG